MDAIQSQAKSHKKIRNPCEITDFCTVRIVQVILNRSALGLSPGIMQITLWMLLLTA